MNAERFVNSKAFALAIWLLLPIAAAGQTPDPIETIRVDSDLVDLKVSVVSLKPQNPLPELRQRDFVVLEDGKPQEIAFFAAAEAPFDLVLLLDLSGSTKDKLKLIRNSAKRFVETARPLDRVSVVTFSRSVEIVCPLTLDRKLLKESIDDIEEPEGGTNFWDALNHVLRIFRATGNESRRSAVVVMTDGVDNALPDVAGDGSSITFDQLVTNLRRSSTVVFPIYLDTEEQEIKRHRTSRMTFALAREGLAQLADVCGSNFYRANKLGDLDDVYKQVIGDLGRVYSLGYRPSNTVRDGSWRAVRVQIVQRTDVVARTRQGYFAKGMTN